MSQQTYTTPQPHGPESLEPIKAGGGVLTSLCDQAELPFDWALKEI